jgi:hypothetical protein
MSERPDPSPQERGETALPKKSEVEPRLHYDPEKKGQGWFLEMHQVMKEDGKLLDLVYKEFHLDLVFDEETAVKIFAAQANEDKLLRKYFPKDMVPRSVFVVREDLKDVFEKARMQDFDAATYTTIFWNNVNRLLHGRYSKDTTTPGLQETFFAKALRTVGEVIEKKKDKQKPVGAVLQPHVNGITFGELFKRDGWQQDPKFGPLKTNVEKLLNGMRRFHKEVPRGVFPIHTLFSDNVLVETDKDGQLTGRVSILDTNSIRRPDTIYKRISAGAIERRILQPVEIVFGLQQTKKGE